MRNISLQHKKKSFILIGVIIHPTHGSLPVSVGHTSQGPTAHSGGPEACWRDEFVQRVDKNMG